jgi:DnaK suppressor protein
MRPYCARCGTGINKRRQKQLAAGVLSDSFPALFILGPPGRLCFNRYSDPVAHGPDSGISGQKVRQYAMPQENKEFALSNFTPYELGKDEEYMNDAQLEHFASILRNWKQELMEEVDRTKEHMQTELNNYADPNDRASQEEEFSLELRTRDRERKLIKKIEKTLDLIDKGDYGYCSACGVEIGIRRLEARPTADLCIDCKTLAEIKEKQLGV